MANERIFEQDPTVGLLSEDRVVPHEANDGTGVTEKATVAQLRGTLVPGWDPGTIQFRCDDGNQNLIRFTAGSILSDDGEFVITTAGTETVESIITGTSGFDPAFANFADLWAYLYVLGDSSATNPTVAIAVQDGVDPLSLPSTAGWDKKRLVGAVFVNGALVRFSQSTGSGGLRRIQSYDTPANLAVLTNGSSTTFAFVPVGQAGIFNSGVIKFAPPFTTRATLRIINGGPAVTSLSGWSAGLSNGPIVLNPGEQISTDWTMADGPINAIFYINSIPGGGLDMYIEAFYMNI